MAVTRNHISQYDVVPIKENYVKLYKVRTILVEDENAFTDSLFEQMIILSQYLDVHSLEREHFYIIACNDEHRIKGIILLNVGEYNKVSPNPKKMILFLLLIDANEFYSIHNHPNHHLKGSQEDALMDATLLSTGSILDIPYKGGYVLDENGYVNTMTNELVSFRD